MAFFHLNALVTWKFLLFSISEWKRETFVWNKRLFQDRDSKLLWNLFSQKLIIAHRYRFANSGRFQTPMNRWLNQLTVVLDSNILYLNLQNLTFSIELFIVQKSGDSYFPSALPTRYEVECDGQTRSSEDVHSCCHVGDSMLIDANDFVLCFDSPASVSDRAPSNVRDNDPTLLPYVWNECWDQLADRLWDSISPGKSYLNRYSPDMVTPKPEFWLRVRTTRFGAPFS